MASVLIFFILPCLVSLVSGHGRLVEPPSRSSMWRFGFDTPHDYDDTAGYCGGFNTQWAVNGGKCGVCGDAWDAEVKEHEAPGGKFATGTIVREYTAGQTIDISVEVTANHRGSFTFRLCRAPSAEQDPSQECLDQHLLTTSTGEQEWVLPSESNGMYDLQVELPQDYECTQCLLQWTWRVANSWGTCEDGSGAVGCGKQEHFRACADVSITREEDEKPSTEQSTSTTTTTTTTVPNESTSTLETTTTTGSEGSCQATGAYEGSEEMDDWCEANCHHPTQPYCPPTHCKCS